MTLGGRPARGIVILGTGAADGVPQPFCACATCADARVRGLQRAPSGVLVDGEVLLDAAPGVGVAAARAGVSLADVHTIAVTHAHSDHWFPALLLHRQWQLGSRPLRLIGPQSVIDEARGWLPPDHNMELVAAAPGMRVSAGAHDIVVHPATHGDRGASDAPVDPMAAEAVLYSVVTGERSILYACDTGMPDTAVLESVRGAGFDIALIELTFGATGVRHAGHLDLVTFPSALAELRKVGAISAATDVIAMHLSHHLPPSDVLERTLADWGARVVPDGTWLERRGVHAVLITGGARSGKSAAAERLAAACAPAGAGGIVTYIATSGHDRDDAEWAARVAAHRQRRPASWRTIETRDIGAALRTAPRGGTVLVECLTTWVAGVIDAAEAWEVPTDALTAVRDAVADLVASLAHTTAANVIFVTNEVGDGIVPATSSGRLFRDALGEANATVAAVCDDVVLAVAGRTISMPTSDVVRLAASVHAASVQAVPAGVSGNPTTQEEL